MNLYEQFLPAVAFTDGTSLDMLRQLEDPTRDWQQADAWSGRTTTESKSRV